jgi:hypothetical protein
MAFKNAALEIANEKMEELLPDIWEPEESKIPQEVRQTALKAGHLRIYLRQFRAKGEKEPFRSVVDVARINGDSEFMAGWHPKGHGEPFNLDAAGDILKQLKDSKES